MKAVLSNGEIVTGTLYPTIPGKNAFRLSMHSAHNGARFAKILPLTVTMLDMHMNPERPHLLRHGDRSYAGAINLPMFGRYRLSFSVRTGNRRLSGRLTVELPLPHM